MTNSWLPDLTFTPSLQPKFFQKSPPEKSSWPALEHSPSKARCSKEGFDSSTNAWTVQPATRVPKVFAVPSNCGQWEWKNGRSQITLCQFIDGLSHPMGQIYHHHHFPKRHFSISPNIPATGWRERANSIWRGYSSASEAEKIESTFGWMTDPHRRSNSKEEVPCGGPDRGAKAPKQKGSPLWER